MATAPSPLAADTARKLSFKVKTHVTLPLLKIPDDGTPAYVKLTAAIFKAKKIHGSEAAEGSKAAMEAPELVHVVNLETNEPAQMIVSTVFGTELREAYPENAYIGKNFEVKKFKMQGGKRYATFQITEIEVDGDTSQAEAKIEEVKAAEAKTEPETLSPAPQAHTAKQGSNKSR